MSIKHSEYAVPPHSLPPAASNASKTSSHPIAHPIRPRQHSNYEIAHNILHQPSAFRPPPTAVTLLRRPPKVAHIMSFENLNGPDGCWTNEMHVNFLNSMEASFVRTMLENNGRLLRLDRYLPDSSESTQDLKRQRRRKSSTSDVLNPRARNGGRTDKKTRTLSSQPDNSSQDQVVPQLEHRTGDKD